MWHDYPFSQRNKTPETAVGVGLQGYRKGGVGQNLKKGGGRQYRGSS